MAERGALLDMALDDIIKNNDSQRPGGRGGRGRGRGSFRGGQRRQAPTSGGAIRRDRTIQRRAFVPYQKRSGNSDGFWEHDRFEDEEEEEFVEAPRRTGVSAALRDRLGAGAGAAVSAKVQVSNLEHSVTDEDLEELFSTVGQLQKVVLKYDRSGRSNGIAEVYFVRKADALKAVKEYNGVSIDGKPMALALASAIPTAPAAAVYTPRERVESRPTVRVSLSGRPAQSQSSGFRGGRGTRGGFRGGRGGRGGFRSRNQDTEDISSSALDAELDAYMEQS
eukprot:TRINITY_DN2652_c0_g1_i1.p1 TRINITY_DN2652_c0_g1~~TRINITY_DN2652_c0_g1_i1.p1  ORF type:complete len:296 (-),score=24.46 TRINITY_DN2652_c0_g1_i1:155-991(-)